MLSGGPLCQPPLGMGVRPRCLLVRQGRGERAAENALYSGLFHVWPEAAPSAPALDAVGTRSGFSRGWRGDATTSRQVSGLCVTHAHTPGLTGPARAGLRPEGSGNLAKRKQETACSRCRRPKLRSQVPGAPAPLWTRISLPGPRPPPCGARGTGHVYPEQPDPPWVRHPPPPAPTGLHTELASLACFLSYKDPARCALSPRPPDNKGRRHWDAIHCHLFVYHRFLFKPLHSSLGRARLFPCPLPPSLGPGRKQEALSVLIALLDRRCLCSAV